MWSFHFQILDGETLHLMGDHLLILHPKVCNHGMGEVVGVNDFYHNNGEGHLLELFLGDLQWIMKNNKHKAWRWWSRNSIQIVMIVKLKDIGLMNVCIHLIGSKHIYKSSFAPRVLKRFLPWHEWRTFFCI